jgi:hypothetical protein
MQINPPDFAVNIPQSDSKTITSILVTSVNLIILSIYCTCIIRCNNNVVDMSMSWSYRDTNWFTPNTPVMWKNSWNASNITSEIAWTTIMNSTDCARGSVYMGKSLSWNTSEKTGLCTCLYSQRYFVTLSDMVQICVFSCFRTFTILT